MNDVDAAIVATVAATGSLSTIGGTWFMRPPPETPLPYMTFRRSPSDKEDAFGSRFVESAVYTFNIYASEKGQVETLQDALIATFDQKRLSLTTDRHVGTYKLSEWVELSEYHLHTTGEVVYRAETRLYFSVDRERT